MKYVFIIQQSIETVYSRATNRKTGVFSEDAFIKLLFVPLARSLCPLVTLNWDCIVLA